MLRFTWCQRQKNEKRGKNEIFTSNSILHRGDGTSVIRPAVLNEAQADREVDRLSTKFGEKGRVLYAPALLGVPRAMIASWGQIELVPVDKDALRVAGQSSEMSDDRFLHADGFACLSTRVGFQRPS